MLHGFASDPAGRWRRKCALIVEQLGAALDLLRRQLREVLRKVRTDGEPTLYAGPCAHLLEPAFYVLELFEVLLLGLRVHDPGVGDDVSDRVVGPSQVAALVEAVVEDAVEAVHLIAKPTGGL